MRPRAELGLDKGPFVPPPAGRDLQAFMGEFCLYLPYHDMFPPAYKYHHSASDINWWLKQHDLAQADPAGVVCVYRLVHETVSLARLCALLMSKPLSL